MPDIQSLRVAVTADVGKDRGLPGTVSVGTGGEWIMPQRALPRGGADERLDRASRSVTSTKVPMKHTPTCGLWFNA
jgi:hypothetical protein